MHFWLFFCLRIHTTLLSRPLLVFFFFSYTFAHALSWVIEVTSSSHFFHLKIFPLVRRCPIILQDDHGEFCCCGRRRVWAWSPAETSKQRSACQQFWQQLNLTIPDCTPLSSVEGWCPSPLRRRTECFPCLEKKRKTIRYQLHLIWKLTASVLPVAQVKCE